MADELIQVPKSLDKDNESGLSYVRESWTLSSFQKVQKSTNYISSLEEGLNREVKES